MDKIIYWTYGKSGREVYDLFYPHFRDRTDILEHKNITYVRVYGGSYNYRYATGSFEVERNYFESFLPEYKDIFIDSEKEFIEVLL